MWPPVGAVVLVSREISRDISRELLGAGPAEGLVVPRVMVRPKKGLIFFSIWQRDVEEQPGLQGGFGADMFWFISKCSLHDWQ